MDDKKICNDCNCAYYGSACPLCGKDESGKIVKSFYEQNNRSRNVRKSNKTAFIFILLIVIVLGVAFKDNIVGIFTQDETLTVNNNSVPFPENGTMYYYTQSKLTGYLNLTSELDNYLLLKVKDELGSKTLVDVYIHPNSTVKIDLPYGKYKLYYAGGYTWYGRERFFGSDTMYFISRDMIEITEFMNQTMTVYMPENPTPFSSMQKTYKDEFKD